MRFNDFLQNLDLSYDESMDALANIEKNPKSAYFNPFDEWEENQGENKSKQEAFFENPTKNPTAKLNMAIKTSSYPMLRQWIDEGKKMPTEAVRIEEMLNSFENTNLSAPNLMNVYTELCVCPWNESNYLLQVILAAQKPTYSSQKSALEGKSAQVLERKLVAQQVVLQTKFNPEKVENYRILGYENQLLNRQHKYFFAKNSWYTGQQACIFYEIEPKNVLAKDALLTLQIDFQVQDRQFCAEKNIIAEVKNFSQSSDYLRFMTSVAMFGMYLKDSEPSRFSLQQISTIANRAYQHRNYQQQDFLKMLKMSFLLS